MKRLAGILAFLIISLIGFSQISLDSVGFKAYRVSVHYKGQVLNANSDVLFFIQNGKMASSVDNQYQTAKFLTTPVRKDMGFDNDNLVAESVDQGGYKCSFFIVFTPASETNSGRSDIYTIAIGYSNILFIYECKKTDERLWISPDPLDVEVLVNQNNQYRNDPKYSDQEIEEFFDQFGNGKLIKNAIVQDFYMEYTGVMTNLNN
jgi:hypothetical protein